jgi:hypothetical protein
VQRAPGIPHALVFWGERFINSSGASRRGVAKSRLKLAHCVEARHARAEARSAFALDVPGIHALAASKKDVDGRDKGERKRRRPSDGYARP